jgi:hypothetical protein
MVSRNCGLWCLAFANTIRQLPRTSESSRSKSKNRKPATEPGAHSARTSTSLSGRKSSRKIEPKIASRRIGQRRQISRILRSSTMDVAVNFTPVRDTPSFILNFASVTSLWPRVDNAIRRGGRACGSDERDVGRRASAANRRGQAPKRSRPFVNGKCGSQSRRRERRSANTREFPPDVKPGEVRVCPWGPRSG